MAVYLNEEQFGYAPDLIGFPNLLLCMGLVCMTGNMLYGVHLTNPGNTAPVMAEFAKWLSANGVTGDRIAALYGASNWAERYPGSGNQKADWQREMAEIKRAIGFQGTPRGFNTNIFVTNVVGLNSTRYGRAKTKGFYVEYHPDYVQSTCRIFYKKNWKMDFTPATDGSKPAVVQYGLNKDLQPVLTNRLKTGDTRGVAMAPGSSSVDLHELEYGPRLIDA